MKTIKERYEEAEFNIYRTIDEFRPNYDIFDEDEIEIKNIKKVIFNELDETERRIILSYAEIGNIRDTAKLFMVSSTTIWSKIKEIQNKIKSFLNDDNN